MLVFSWKYISCQCLIDTKISTPYFFAFCIGFSTLHRFHLLNEIVQLGFLVCLFLSLFNSSLKCNLLLFSFTRQRWHHVESKCNLMEINLGGQTQEVMGSCSHAAPPQSVSGSRCCGADQADEIKCWRGLAAVKDSEIEHKPVAPGHLHRG